MSGYEISLGFQLIAVIDYLKKKKNYRLIQYVR